MTNEELKKKIKEILRKRMTELLGSCHTDEIPLTEEGAEAILFHADEFADALIAAGIGDVSKWKAYAKAHRIVITKDDKIKQLYSDEEVDKIVIERAEYKYRAEVAERAGRIIQRDMARVFDISNPRVCELIANIWDLAKKQAEKELAEEGKDENN